MEDIDLLICGATLIDGTGARPRRADVAIVGERIAAVGDLSRMRVVESIDATGLLLARAGSAFTHITTARRPGTVAWRHRRCLALRRSL